MRKLLLSTTALASAAVLTANIAVADVSISATTEWKYVSTSSNVTAQDGTKFDHDSEIAFNFSNKTDSGLTIGYTVELDTDASTATPVDESSFSISGGFGKIVLGQNDGVGDNYGISAEDAIAEEHSPTLTGATIRQNTDMHISSNDNNKVAYHLPKMGGLTAGISYEDSGNVGSTDITAVGFNYTMQAAGNTITIGGGTATQEATTTDTDHQNLGVKVVSGNLTFIAAQASKEAVDEDINSVGAALSYKMGNGMVLGAYTMKSEDDLDAGEEYSTSGVEVQYTIAAGLTAVVNVSDYDYKIDTTGSATADSGTISKFTIKASF
ncbi:MAG: porin [Proteobacteria bacterium]|nr:porin [Pseudomonadota bacterium]